MTDYQDQDPPKSNVVQLISSNVSLGMSESRVYDLMHELFTVNQRALLFATMSHFHHLTEQGYLDKTCDLDVVEVSREIMIKILLGEDPEKQDQMLAAVKTASKGLYSLTLTRKKKKP